MRSFVCTVVAYYRLLLRLLLNLGGDGAYLYGGDELGVWALLVLMRNMPPMPEAKAKCPSQVFRRLDMGACRCVRAKLLLYNALVWMSPFIGLVATGAFAMFRRCTFQKSYWMLLFRPDLVAFAMTQRWTKHFGDYWGADRQFSRVDLHRAYSLIIRSAYHVVDVNECPDQGRLEDKAFFQEAGARLGVPVVRQIPHRALPSVPDEDYPLFAKPATLQWGEGVLEIAHRGDDGYVKALADPECIVQRRLANRRDMQPMFPPRAPLCTARITTFRTKQGVKILEAWLRVGASDALADQFENGGATFAVYAESGVVWHGSTAAAMAEGSPELEPSLGRAPGASRDIAGHALPLWSDAVAMVKTAHETLAPNAFSVGWDVVLGEEHVRVLEGNLASMVALHVGMRCVRACVCCDQSTTEAQSFRSVPFLSPNTDVTFAPTPKPNCSLALQVWHHGSRMAGLAAVLACALRVAMGKAGGLCGIARCEEAKAAGRSNKPAASDSRHGKREGSPERAHGFWGWA